MDLTAKEILRKEREPLELALERLLTEISQLREEAAHVQDSINLKFPA